MWGGCQRLELGMDPAVEGLGRDPSLQNDWKGRTPAWYRRRDTQISDLGTLRDSIGGCARRAYRMRKRI